MAYQWCINESYRNTPIMKYFASLDIAKGNPGQYITSDPICRVIRLEIQGQYFYLKYYLYGGKNLRRYFLRSRARAEWENLQYLQSLGIPTPKIVVYGEERTLGFFRQGMFVTEAIENSANLMEFAGENPELMVNSQWVKSVLKRLADYIARIHKQEFVHRDLKWRNILIVNTQNQPQLYFIDCPSGSKPLGFLLKRQVIKDLATFDLSAKQHISRTMRLRFFCYYKGIQKLTEEDKQYITRIVTYFKKKN